MNEFTVPQLWATYDFGQHVLEGRGPLDGILIATIPNGFFNATRHIRQQPDRRFGVDTSDLHPFVGSYGSVQHTDRWGNQVIYYFTIRGYPLYLAVVGSLVAFP